MTHRCRSKTVERFLIADYQISRADGQRQSYVGLAQTCRQLRHEYRPLYEAGTEFEVGTEDLDKFIRDWYPQGRKIPLPSATTTTTVLVAGEGAFNLLALIRAEQSFPGLRFALRSWPQYYLRRTVEECDSILALHRSIDSRKRDQWLGYLENFRSVRISLDDHNPELKFKKARRCDLSKSALREVSLQTLRDLDLYDDFP